MVLRGRHGGHLDSGLPFKKDKKTIFLVFDVIIWQKCPTQNRHLIPFEIYCISLAECDLKKMLKKANNKNTQILSINVLSHFQKANVIDFQIRASCQPQLPLQCLATLELA
jgi:hypothetical protein